MKLTPLLFLVVTLATSLFAADPAFDAWADALAADMVRADPIDATHTQYFTGTEQDALDRQLTPITREYRAARIAAAKKALAKLAKFDRTKLDARQRTSAGVIGQFIHEQLPHRQDMDMPIPHHPDIQFAPLDILFDERASPHARVNKGHAFLEFLVV